MDLAYDEGGVKLYLGNCIDMSPIPDESVHCVVTSPPYFGLRDYGLGPNQLGLEKSPQEYVEQIVSVFREVRRVLRKDGAVWLNLGDSYAGSMKGIGADGKAYAGPKQATNIGSVGITEKPVKAEDIGLKPKDLIGIPWMVAFALRADGWYLRMDNIWAKGVSGQKAVLEQVFAAALEVGIPEWQVVELISKVDPYNGNPMPESARDRPTRAHEYMFLLSKCPNYYYDSVAVRDSAKEGGTHKRDNFRGGTTDPRLKHNGSKNANNAEIGRNRRSVWTIPTAPFHGSHFATYPPALVEPCILAGASECGCCPVCGKSWERVVKTEYGVDKSSTKHIAGGDKTIGAGWEGTQRRADVTVTTLGWHPACACCMCTAQSVFEYTDDVNMPALWQTICRSCGRPVRPYPPVPCTVLDPFCGTGTTLKVAHDLGRNAIGIDLDPKSIFLSIDRLEGRKPL